MKKLADFLGYSLLGLFLFATHSQMFYWLKPEFISGIMIDFSWINFNEKTIQAEIFGALFGMMTVYIIARKKQNPLYRIFIIAIAIFDGLVVFYLNEADLANELRMLFASVHYSLYTIFIILMFGYPDKKQEQKNEIVKEIIREKRNISLENSCEIDKKVLQLLQSGMKGNEIAKELGTSESKISRIKKRWKQA